MGVTIKIFRKNNYIIIIDENNVYYEEHYSNVLVKKFSTTDEIYDISFLRPNKDVQNFYKILFQNIKQENGSNFASVAAWEEWYTSNTGFNNSGSVSADVNANLKVGGSNVSNTNPVPVNIITGGGSTTVADVSLNRVTGTTAQTVAVNALSISLQNIGNYSLNVSTGTSVNIAIDPGVSITWDAPASYKLPAYTIVNTNAAGVFLLTVLR